MHGRGIAQVAVMDQLIAAGARTELPSMDGRAAIHFAAFNGHFDAARRLCDADARVDQFAALTNGAGLGHTAMLIASFQGNYRIVKLLLKRGRGRPAPAPACPSLPLLFSLPLHILPFSKAVTRMLPRRTVPLLSLRPRPAGTRRS